MKPLARAWSGWIGAATLAAFLVGGGWVAAHRIPWHSTAAQLWTEKDLPSLPDDRDNGWVIANAAAGWLKGDVVPLGLSALHHGDHPLSPTGGEGQGEGVG